MNHRIKDKAIELRKQGLTYSEILREVPVAKSTLSLWLRSVGISKRQRQKLTAKKIEASRRGGLARKTQRIEKTKSIKELARIEVLRKNITNEDLWLIGTMLYWAEGTKEKEYRPSARVGFINSDPRMIKIFLRWMDKCLGVDRKQIGLRVYLHENHKEDAWKIANYWSKVTGFSVSEFDRICYKTNKVNSNRRNKDLNYKGLVKIEVKKSTDLNRKISGWIDEICKQWGVV